MLASRSAAPTSIRGPTSAIRRQPFFRSCSTDRHSAIAGRDGRRSERKQVRSRVRTAAELQPGALRVRPTLHKHPALDDAHRQIRTCGTRAEFVDNPCIEQRVVGSGHQKRPLRFWIAADGEHGLGDGRGRFPELDARIFRDHGGDPVRSLRQHEDALDVRTVEQRADRTSHHGLTGNRHQCLDVIAELSGERVTTRSGAGEQDRRIFHASNQETIRCPRAAASVA